MLRFVIVAFPRLSLTFFEEFTSHYENTPIQTLKILPPKTEPFSHKKILIIFTLLLKTLIVDTR